MSLQVYRIADVMHRTGLARSTVYKLMKQGEFPESFQLTETAVGWTEQSIEDFIEKRIALSRKRKESK
jgi:prophage regulatory protein